MVKNIMMSIIVVLSLSIILAPQNIYSFTIEYNKGINIKNNYFTIEELVIIDNIINDENFLSIIKTIKEFDERDILNNLDYYYIKKDRLLIKEPSNRFYLGYERIRQQEIIVDKELLMLLEKNNNENKNYNLFFSMLKQEVEGLVLGLELFSNSNHAINVFLETKLLKGKELIENNYDGFIEKKEDRMFMTAYSDGINTNLNNIGLINDGNFLGKGYSFGVKVNYKKNNYKLEFIGENILNNILWEKAYTYTHEYYKSSLGLYPSDKDSYDRGNIGYANYKTKLKPSYDLSITNDFFKIGLVYKRYLYPYIKYNINKEPANFSLGLVDKFITAKLAYKLIEIELSSDKLNLFSSNIIFAKININY